MSNIEHALQSILMELLYTISSISNGAHLKNKKNKCTECILEFGFCGSSCGSNCRKNCGKNSIHQTKIHSTKTTKVLFAQSKADFSSLC